VAQSIFDERDIMFNVVECPGSSKVLEIEKYEDFGVDDLEMIFEQARQFADDHLFASNAECDREGSHLDKGIVKTPDVMKKLWADYVEIGTIGVSSNPEYGGTGMPHLFATPLTELDCGGNLSFSMINLLTREAANVIDSFGTDELKDIYLEPLFSGQWTGTMCLTEPQAGSDVGAASSKAIPQSDGSYLIEGTKSFISWGDHDLTENIIHLVLARIEGAPKSSKGLSLFVVPKIRVDENGQLGAENDVICSSVEHKMGIKASPTCVLNFGENGACQGFLIGEANAGLSHMFQMMNAARNGVGIQGLAIASVAANLAEAYAKERKQGSLPGQKTSIEIAHHPDVKFMIWKMRALVQAIRSLIYHGAYFEDLRYHPEEAEKAETLFALLTPINKSYATDLGFKVTELAMQVYGGYGFCQDFPIEQLMRDIKITSIYEGTNGIQALDLVFRKILGSKGKATDLLIQEIEKILADAKPKMPDEVEKTESCLKSFKAALAHIGQLAGSGNFLQLQFHATQFMLGMGHLVGAAFLLKSASIAHAKYESDAFYKLKVDSTRFFIDYVLPEANSIFHTVTIVDGGLVKETL